MRIKKENIIISFLLFVSVVSFFAFGFFHIAKFETTDEHLWKYDRIGHYWQAIKNKDWEKTYINDKPGITVALISGFGLLAYPNPEQTQKIANPIAAERGRFDMYDTTHSQNVNFAFRLPILIFATLSLLLSFWLILRAFGSSWLALLSVMFIALNPILVGISQVINPDSFFWIFGSLSVFSFFALLNTSEKKFLVLCGIFTGFALLSKYTAILLFVFYFIAIFSKITFQSVEENQKTNYRKFFIQAAINILTILLLSIITFSIFLPAVFLNPNYLFKGISQFIGLKKFILIAFAGTLFCGLIAYSKNILQNIVSFFIRYKNILLISVCSLFSLIIIISFLNVWTGQKIIPFDDLRDAAYTNEPKEFNFKPLLAGENDFHKKPKLFMLEAYPFIFSLSPLLIFLIFFISVKSWRKNISDKNATIIFSVLSFALLYFLFVLFARIVTNARYLIMLYPLFAILGAATTVELAKSIRLKNNYLLPTLFSIVIFILGTVTLWSIRPFYFSYTNWLLPKQFSIHESWGHGSFEAAEYLNQLPDAKNLVIWSNSDTVCRFFVGKCLRSRKIDLSIITPDYFVISKRGELKTANHFILLNSPTPKKNSDYYFEKLKNNYEWQIIINNRPNNFIKIVKFEK